MKALKRMVDVVKDQVISGLMSSRPSIMRIQRFALIAATVTLTGALSAAPAFANAGKYDTCTDGADAGKFDPYTDGAKAGRYMSSSDGAPL